MLLWLKDNLAMRKNGRPALCSSCPCQELLFPEIVECFPFPPLGEPGVTDIGSINWNFRHRLNLYDYDPDTDLWIDIPYWECAGEPPYGTVYYFGFTEYVWRSLILNDFFDPDTGGFSDPMPVRPTPYFYNLFELGATNPANDHSIEFRFTNFPENMVSTLGPWMQIKPEFEYVYDVYDRTSNPDGDLIYQGAKIIVHYLAHEIEESGHYYYPINFDGFDYDKYASTIVAYDVYDNQGNLAWSSFIFNDKPPVYSLGCLPDVDYSVLGKCNFSSENCEGCLESVEFLITSDTLAGHLDGVCKSPRKLDRKGSYSFTLISSGFETQSAAQAYIDENIGALTEQLKSQCAGNYWYIVGICECPTGECEDCEKIDGSISVMCENDFQACYEKNGTYYKMTKLAVGTAFETITEAQQYWSEHTEEINEELEEACPGEGADEFTVYAEDNCGHCNVDDGGSCNPGDYPYNQFPSNSVEIDIPADGNYKITYTSGAWRASPSARWNGTAAPGGGAVATGYMAIVRDGYAGRTLLPRSSYNIYFGFSTAEEAESWNVGRSITIPMTAGKAHAYFEFKYCQYEQQGSVTYTIERVS